MSKLARKPIDISNLDVTFEDGLLTVKGSKGALSLAVRSDVTLTISDELLSLQCDNKAILGLYCALIKNMVIGVTELFSKTLLLKGVGYRVSLDKTILNFNLGYSHPVSFELPDGVSVELPNQTEIRLTGMNKQFVGQVAANIIRLRAAKKDPYKGKGIRLSTDRLRVKVGKKVK